MASHWNRVGFDWMLGRNSLLRGWWGTCTGCPKKLWMPHSWMSSRPGWMGLRGTWSSEMCPFNCRGVLNGWSSNPGCSVFLWFSPRLWANFGLLSKALSLPFCAVSLSPKEKSFFSESSRKHVYLSSCLVSLPLLALCEAVLKTHLGAGMQSFFKIQSLPHPGPAARRRQPEVVFLVPGFALLTAHRIEQMKIQIWEHLHIPLPVARLSGAASRLSLPAIWQKKKLFRQVSMGTRLNASTLSSCLLPITSAPFGSSQPEVDRREKMQRYSSVIIGTRAEQVVERENMLEMPWQIEKLSCKPTTQCQLHEPFYKVPLFPKDQTSTGPAGNQQTSTLQTRLPQNSLLLLIIWYLILEILRDERSVWLLHTAGQSSSSVFNLCFFIKIFIQFLKFSFLYRYQHSQVNLHTYTLSFAIVTWPNG